MARPTVDNLRSLGDFQTTVDWDIQFIELPAVLSDYLPEDLNLQCESTDIPKSSGTSTDVWLRGHKSKQPGLWTPVGTITMTMNETVDGYVREFIRRWREACWQSRTGIQQTKSDVEAQIMLYQLDRQNNYQYQYHMIGVYLEDYDTGGQLQAQSADLLKPTLTLSYDYFIDGPFSGGNSVSVDI